MNLLDQNIELRSALQQLLTFTEHLYVYGSPYLNSCPQMENAQRLLARSVNHSDCLSAQQLINLLTGEQRQQLLEMLKINQTDLQGQNDDAHDLYSWAQKLVTTT